LTAAIKPTFWPALARGVMPTVESIEAIQRLSPQTLIDVGANKGQFSLMTRYLFPQIDIHAFEPLERERQIYATVVRPPVRLYPTALGRVPGQATFFVTSRADSSSLLQPGTTQQAEYGMVTNRRITVPVACLPDVIDVASLRRPILLKLDVQGAELDVLRGAESVLFSVDMIYCEISYVELYEGQPLVGEIAAYLQLHGFSLRGVYNQATSKEFGPLQADFLFMLNRVTP